MKYIFFMMLTFSPNLKQLEASQKWMDGVTEQICFGGAKYGGKSFLGANLIFADALTYPDTYYFIAREELNDLRKYTIPTIHEVFKIWGVDMGSYARYNGQDSYFHCYNNSRVYLIETKKNPGDPLYERFGSMQFTRGWMEEAGEQDVLAKENLWATIGRKNNNIYGLKKKLLITCNPKKNWLYNQFWKPWSIGQLSEDRAFIQSLPTDNIKGDKDYIQTLSKMKDRVMLDRLFYGNWDYDTDDNALFDYDRLNNLFSNDFIKGGIKYITADIARSGSDLAVIYVWDGLRVIDYKMFQVSRLTDIEASIKKFCLEYKIPMSNVIADEDGVGGGVIDHLGCKGFVNNSTAIARENFGNLKSQCYYKLAEYINADMICIAIKDLQIHDKIKEELNAHRKHNIDKDRKLMVTPKDEVKQNIGRSPDFADALMMRMFFELKKAPVLV